MSNKSKHSNGLSKAGASNEGLTPGRCSLGEQNGPDRHRTTADRRKKKMVSRREQSSNAMPLQKWVWEKWIQKRMHTIWNEMGISDMTDQRLVDQRNNILKRKWLSDLELKEIQKGYRTWQSVVGKQWREGMVVGIWSRRTGCVYEKIWSCARLHFEEERSNAFVIKMNMQITNGDMSIIKKCAVCYRKRQEKDCHHWGEFRSIHYWRPIEKKMRLWIRLKLKISQTWMILYMLVL